MGFQMKSDSSSKLNDICFKFQMGLPAAHAYNSPVPLYSQVSANIALSPQSHLFQKMSESAIYAWI